jgi:hypothetical protein
VDATNSVLAEADDERDDDAAAADAQVDLLDELDADDLDADDADDADDEPTTPGWRAGRKPSGGS